MESSVLRDQIQAQIMEGRLAPEDLGAIAETIRLRQRCGLGSQIVGCTTSGGNRWISLACRVCEQCGGLGRRPSDGKYLCRLCGGAGARAFGLFVSGENRLKDGRVA